jgi:O-antigen/teichoic acid export membrane protein
MRRSIAASFSIVAAAATASAGGVVVTLAVARVLGLHALGQYAVIATVAGALGILDSARTQDLTARYAASLHPGHFSSRIKLAGLAELIAIAAAIGFGVVEGSRVAVAAGLAWTGSAVMVATGEGVAAAQARGRFSRLASANACGSVVSAAISVALLWTWGIVAVGLGMFVGSCLSRGLLLLDARGFHGAASATPEQGIRPLRALALLGGAAQIVNFTDVLTISALSGSTEVGRYRAGAQIPTQLVALIFRGFDVLMPRLAASDDAAAVVLVRRAARYLSVVVGGSCGLMIVGRRPLVHLILGHDSPRSATVLALFSVVWLVNSIVHPASLLLVARRQQHALVKLVWCEYLANLVLTVILVAGHGAVGSAVATLITLSISDLLVMPVILRRELPSVPMVRHIIVDSAVPTFAMAAAVLGVAALLGL